MDNNQENKKNVILTENRGRGLFYGVIAIATFIIMAVGATFAYFTATTESMNNTVQTGSTTLQLKYISYGEAWTKKDLIPADTMVVEYSIENQSDVTISNEVTDEEGEVTYPINGNNTLCKDDYGNSICSVYVFQVTNSAASPQSVSLNVVSEKNGFASLNAMAYEIAEPTNKEDYESTENGNRINDPIFKKNADDKTEGAINVTDGTGALLDSDQYKAVYINRNGVEKTLLEYVESRSTQGSTVTVVKKPAIDRALVSLPNPEDELKEATARTAKIADDIEIGGRATKTFALVLYIKNKNEDQTKKDALKTFSGKVVVSSGDGNTGVSGTIGAVSAEDFDPNKLQSNKTEPSVEPTDPGQQG